MNDARPYASLSSGLLARKGTAKPAMRPQGYNGNLEDLGWNDMGQAPGEPAAPAPLPEHVPSSIAALTPAPKAIKSVHPDRQELDEYGDHGEDYYGEEYEEEEAAEIAGEEPVADPFEAPAEVASDPVDEPLDQPFPVAGSYEAPAEVAGEADEEPFPAAEPYEAAVETGFHDEPEQSVQPVQPADPFAAPPVIAQQRAILERFDGAEAASDEHAAAPGSARADIVPMPQRASAEDRRKAAFTLRLDSERHLKLRLACAVSGRSAQQIVARALDEALASIPELENLASQVPVKPGRAGGRKA